MIYRGVKLILDNFRVLLKDYSLDIQDIVRSAILDDIDLSNYLDSCKDNPFRLDQLRLAMKEGLAEHFYSIENGDILYKIRCLRNNGYNLGSLESQMYKGVLSDEYYSKVLSWIEDGLDFSDLYVAKIPPSLLSVFDYGLRKHVNMTKFNNGINFTSTYIKYCISIEENSCSIDKFLLPGMVWNESVLSQMVSVSRLNDKSLYSRLLDSFNYKITSERANIVIKLARRGVEPLVCQELLPNGTYKYSIPALNAIYEAVSRSYDWKTLYAGITDANTMMSRFREYDMKKGKQIRGRL